MYPNVHSSNVHNTQTVERAEMPFSRRMGKEDVGEKKKKKMWVIYTIEYYSAIRKDEYPTFASTWVGWEEIMLSEINQAEKVNYYLVSLICGA